MGVLKKADNLYHFVNDNHLSGIKKLECILKDGFMPSYAEETISQREFLQPMVSFSNILLRDVGEGELIHYGHRAIGLSRDWGTKNNINPVIYNYHESIQSKALEYSFFESIIPNAILSDQKMLSNVISINQCCGGFSKNISSSYQGKGISQEMNKIIDSLTEETSPMLIKALNEYLIKIQKNAFNIAFLTKPYKVKLKGGGIGIAYNDREWRKIYPDLGMVFKYEADKEEVKENIRKEYKNMKAKPKPHLRDEDYRLKFDLENIKVIVVKYQKEIDEIIQFMSRIFNKHKLNSLIESEQLLIGTLADLKAKGI
jgi:hypothetical protein